MTLAIVQARMSSQRMPGKVLADVAGKPMIARQIERVARAKSLDKIVIATSIDASDDPLAALVDSLGIAVFRGSLNDVLARFHGAAVQFGGNPIVRLTGDCPLSDPEVIDTMIAAFKAGSFDCVSNAVDRSYPDGLDVEVLSSAAVERAHREARDRYDREHVTPYIYRNRSRFALSQVRQERDLATLRWTVDEPRDLDFVRAVFKALLPINPAFAMNDILALLQRHPEIAAINAPARTPA